VSTVPDFFTGEFALKLHRQLHILKCGKTSYQIESLKHKSIEGLLGERQQIVNQLKTTSFAAPFP
jgi:hypothetical protein